MSEPYTKIRGEGAEPAEETPMPHKEVLALDILSEEEAVYGDKYGPAFMIKRTQYEECGRPLRVTIILGEESDGEN